MYSAGTWGSADAADAMRRPPISSGSNFLSFTSIIDTPTAIFLYNLPSGPLSVFPDSGTHPNDTHTNQALWPFLLGFTAIMLYC
jgi:hypothetical protein